MTFYKTNEKVRPQQKAKILPYGNVIIVIRYYIPY